MPSPRKGGSVPVRRRRIITRGGPVVPVAGPCPGPVVVQAATGCRPVAPSSPTCSDGLDSDSSWLDTTDTSIDSGGSSDSDGSPRSPATSPRGFYSSSSVDSLSSSDGSGSSVGESSDGREDGDGGGQRTRAKIMKSVRKRGRSWSRRGARDRGGSVVCRYCGKRGYGVMKMILSCCRKIVGTDAANAIGLAGVKPGPSGPSLLEHALASLTAPSGRSVSLPSSPCPRYKWSPCSSDSSSTLSDDGGLSSSGEEADMEAEAPPFALPTARVL